MHLLLHSSRRILFCTFAAAWLCATVPAQTPQWIWHPETNSQTAYFRKTFRTPPLTWNARLTVSADDKAEVFLNGISIARCEAWDQPLRTEVTVRLNQGENVIAIKAINTAGPAGLLAHLNLGGETNLVSSSEWLASTIEEPGWNTLFFNASTWKPSHSLGEHGLQPWGDVLGRTAATPVSSITVPEGFSVQLLRSALPGEGSWVCLTIDPQGRLIISPEKDERPLLRLTLKDDEVTKVEPIQAPLRFAMGLLQLTNTLYANARGPQGAGLYRVVDKNNNDQFESSELELLKKFEGGSEHGYHAITLGPDNKLYVLNGNGTKLPQGISPHSPYKNYRGDVLSPNREETEGDGQAPSGYILRTDLDGKNWELWMGGLRNPFDLDFNEDGELFTFDSDMEWDWGAPWYRSTRVLHCVSGAEFGWREEIRMWPNYYPDTLPAVADVGIGSPTGVKFGYNSKFPEKYRRSLFIMDWSYGRILSVQIDPSGSTYFGDVKPFLQGTPLNVTDLDFGPDGAMYFVTGGRGTQSGLYRVSFNQPTPPIATSTSLTSSARRQRQHLESFHGRSAPEAIEEIWPTLRHFDRHIRYAARIALESQTMELWKDRALIEKDPVRALTSLLALARMGSPAEQDALVDAALRFDTTTLPPEQQLLQMRLLQISIIRQGRPRPALREAIIQKVGRAYPTQDTFVNREIARVLLALQSSSAVAHTVNLLIDSRSSAEQLHYASLLRHVTEGWTDDSRGKFLSWFTRDRSTLETDARLAKWFADVNRAYVDGAWLGKYLADFRRDTVKNLPSTEKTKYASILATPITRAATVPAHSREFVREWKMEDFLSDLGRPLNNRDVARGRQAFADAQCLACHRFGNDGGITGPELAGAARKYDLRSLLESILEPSRVINEQYAYSTVILKDGETLSGRVHQGREGEISLETDPLSGARETILQNKVEQIKPSTVSPMPGGLVNVLSRDEILDLMAYLSSGTSQAP